MRTKRNKTKELWLIHYPDEEFWPIKPKSYLKVDANDTADTTSSFATYISYDIHAACLRQKLFYYQVLFESKIRIRNVIPMVHQINYYLLI